MLPRTVAIDGPASSGKSSASCAVARDLQYLFVDTGAFYRGVTLAALRAGISVNDLPSLVGVAARVEMDITPDRDNDEREYTLLLDGHDVTWNIREQSVESNVSQVAAVSDVRDILNQKYRTLAQRGQVIMVGRDIGTVVLPDADLKIFLDASPEARADRRYRQRQEAGTAANYDEILANLRQRDKLDSTRDVAPLRRPEDAEYLFTDNLSLDQVIAEIKRLIVEWKPKT